MKLQFMDVNSLLFAVKYIIFFIMLQMSNSQTVLRVTIIFSVVFFCVVADIYLYIFRDDKFGISKEVIVAYLRVT
jgi:hypothetical protein